MHEYDPAFHPHETDRVGYYSRGMISPPPRPGAFSKQPSEGEGPRGKEEGEAERAEALVLKGTGEGSWGEGSYRLKKRFEGGSHGEVTQ